MTTIGLVSNVFNEINALPGWLECHLSFFDDMRVLHSGPQGEYSTDGTIELLEKWHIPVQFCAIDEGFGAVRTKALRMCPCDWVMLLDADERFHAVHRILHCSGECPENRDLILAAYSFSPGGAPDWGKLGQLGANLRVEPGAPYNHGSLLRDVIGLGIYDAVATVRRHWHDLSWRRPTQDWRRDPDWQLRTVRNRPDICFSADTRMHERLCGVTSIFHADVERGPMFDHFHFVFKKMELEQRRHDVAIYDKIHAGEKPPTLEEFQQCRS